MLDLDPIRIDYTHLWDSFTSIMRRTTLGHALGMVYPFQVLSKATYFKYCRGLFYSIVSLVCPYYTSFFTICQVPICKLFVNSFYCSHYLILLCAIHAVHIILYQSKVMYIFSIFKILFVQISLNCLYYTTHSTICQVLFFNFLKSFFQSLDLIDLFSFGMS